MNRRPIVIATAIGALGGAIAVIIFLYFFNVWKIARLLTGNHTPPPASMEIDLSPDGEWFLEEKAYIEARLNHFNFRDDHHDNLAFGPHSTSAIAEQDNTIYLISTNIRERSTVLTLKGHTDLVISLAFSPDGSTLLSGSIDKTIRLWDVKTGVCKQTVPINGTLPDE